MKKTEIDYWIAAMLESNKDVSDLNITVGKSLQVESAGELAAVEVFPPVKELTPFQTETFALNLIGDNRRLLRDLVEKGSCDLSYALSDKARFRVNVFTQKGYYTTVLRKLETTIPSIESMLFPEAFGKIANELNGLVLVTGSTGSGKTTSLAAILNRINRDRSVHVITLEDPIEFVHEQLAATFNQRELGNDFSSFSIGLRAALRQAPKVILVGEMRDKETMEIGLSAAETGHLVLSTLHTIDAGQTINRIIGMFDQEEQAQIRNRLMDTIRWIISQRLLPKVGGGRIAAIEILRTSLRVKDLIIHGESEDKTYYNIIEAGSALDMRTFDQHILDLYRLNQITEESALRYCTSRSAVNRGIDQIKAGRGESTTDFHSLEMEDDSQNLEY
jgi:twitching motility protein PilT